MPDAAPAWFDDPQPEAAPAPRAKRRDNAEHGLSHWVDTFLERTVIGDCWFTSIEAGTYLHNQTPEDRIKVERRRRARGIKPAHLDWYLWQRSTGIYVQFELKVKGRPLRRGQRDTIAALTRQHIATSVCETVPQVHAFLIDAGFELHGNAANIATELHERYLGQRRKAAA